jgi:mycothiol synthase
MNESALGVDSENLSGATRVYEDCGFRVVKRNTVDKKPLITIGQP